MKNEVLSDTESELLIAFEGAPSLEKLALKRSRDATVISRQLTRIASKGEYLVKISGRWKITELGKKHNQIVRDFHFSRNALTLDQNSMEVVQRRLVKHQTILSNA